MVVGASIGVRLLLVQYTTQKQKIFVPTEKGKTMAKKKMDKLSQDAAAAKAAGMSYGKWKAMQGEQPIRKDPEVPETWKICQYCGKPFKPTTKRPQLYCEAYCGTRAYYERERLKKAKSVN